VPIQAIAADDVAHAIASVAIGPPVNGIVEVAGPDRLRLDELLRVVLRARADSRPVIADPSARYFGRLALAEKALIPGDDAIVGPTGLSEWLRAVQRDERLESRLPRPSAAAPMRRALHVVGERRSKVGS
jgi:uncharacterized protein YbjT (DUF2867 family)